MSFARTSTPVDGEKFRRLRQEIGWTQSMAAERAGYTCRLIRKLENGGPVDWQTYQDVLEAYGESTAQRTKSAEKLLLLLQRPNQIDDRQWAIDWLHAILSIPNPEDGKNSQFSFDGKHSLANDVVLIAGGRSACGIASVLRYFADWRAVRVAKQLSIDSLLQEDYAISIYWSLMQSEFSVCRGSTLLIHRNRSISKIRAHFDV